MDKNGKLTLNPCKTSTNLIFYLKSGVGNFDIELVIELCKNRAPKQPSLRYSMELTFTIDSWCAWSSDRGDWRSDFDPDCIEIAKPNYSTIPAMKRRRMSDLSKIAISTALDCQSKNASSISVKPVCIFVSRHGELVRSMKIIDSMINGDDVSPTDFSMSVHNTALGLFSILTQNREKATSIVAGEDSFGYGLLEACMLIAERPDKKALLVYFDEPLPKTLSQFEHCEKKTICISLLISVAKEGLPSYSVDTSKTKESKSELNQFQELNERTSDFGEMFLDFHRSETSSLKIKSLSKNSPIWNFSRK